ncbi:hypothetical protein JHK87_000951 [Glycine soja]|nr:hypothetical protein JHK87_000951 [Glycine soja]
MLDSAAPRVPSTGAVAGELAQVLGLDDVRVVQAFSPTNDIDPTPIYLSQHSMDSLFQNLFYESLALTSATFASALYNLIPAITFVLAISCSFERLNLRVAKGKAKVLGTLLGIGGAMLLTFIKGAEINIWPFHINLMHPDQHQNSHMASLNVDSGNNKLLGAICSLASCFSFALWLTIQAKMSKEYPCHYSSTALMSTAGAIQATTFGFCFDRDLIQWKLGWNIRLLAVAYSIREGRFQTLDQCLLREYSMTLQAMHGQIFRDFCEESSGDVHYGGGCQPAVLRTFSQRLCKLEVMHELNPSMNSNLVEILKSEASKGKARNKSSCSKAFLLLTRGIDDVVVRIY